MVLYKLYAFCSDIKFKMAATAGLSLTHDPMGKMFQNTSWISNRHKKQNIFRGPSNDHSWAVWFQLSKWDLMGKMFQNASSLKQLGQLKPNCPGKIIGRSSTNFTFFMSIHGQFGFNCPSGFREEAF
jgi:hypothetical protein